MQTEYSQNVKNAKIFRCLHFYCIYKHIQTFSRYSCQHFLLNSQNFTGFVPVIFQRLQSHSTVVYKRKFQYLGSQKFAISQSVDWLASPSVSRSVGWLVSRSVSELIHRSINQFNQSASQSVSQSPCAQSKHLFSPWTTEHSYQIWHHYLYQYLTYAQNRFLTSRWRHLVHELNKGILQTLVSICAKS